MSVSVAHKVVTVALAVGVGGAGVAMIRTKLGCAPEPTAASTEALSHISDGLPSLDPNAPSPYVGRFGTPGSPSPTISLGSIGVGSNHTSAAPEVAPANDPHWEPGEYGSSDEPADPQSTNAPIASAPGQGSADWNNYPLPGANDGAIDGCFSQPGAPAPDAVIGNDGVASDSTVGDGDEISDNDAPADGSIGLSGIGEGGGGTGEGIGLGSIDIFNKKSGGGGPGNGPGAVMAQAQNAPRAAAPEAASLDEELSEVDRKLAKLPIGNIAFNTPEKIPLGESATIELLLSVREAQEQLKQQVHALGPVETSHVRITDKMEARLTGLGFRVEAATPEQQAVSRTEKTAWKWQIEPTKPAKLELNLTLSALIEVDGVPTPRAIQTFARTIVVEVPMSQRVTNLLSDHIELITSALLVPAAGGLFHTYRKRKRRQSTPDDSTPARKAA
jgi:hypothetical protein